MGCNCCRFKFLSVLPWAHVNFASIIGLIPPLPPLVKRHGAEHTPWSVMEGHFAQCRARSASSLYAGASRRQFHCEHGEVEAMIILLYIVVLLDAYLPFQQVPEPVVRHDCSLAGRPAWQGRICSLRIGYSQKSCLLKLSEDFQRPGSGRAALLLKRSARVETLSRCASQFTLRLWRCACLFHLADMIPGRYGALWS